MHVSNGSGARLDKTQVAKWSKALGGWEKMINRAGYTWRGLPAAETENLTEAKADKELRDAAREYALDHPGYIAEVGFWNFARLFNLQGFQPERDSANYLGANQNLGELSVVAFWILALFAIAGAFTRAARRAPPFIWLIPILIALSTVFIAGGYTRYRVPADPFFIWLAALALIAAWQRFMAPEPVPAETPEHDGAPAVAGRTSG